MKKLIVGLYFGLLVILTAATFIEYGWGSTFAGEYIYHSPLFCALWGTLAVLMMFVVYKKRMWRFVPSLLLHVSFVLILLGAGVSFLTSRKGVLHLRTGESTSRFMEQEENRLFELPFSLSLDSFYVKYYPGTEAPLDYVSVVRCSAVENGEQSVVIAMNRTFDCRGYRFYQASYDEDERGTMLSVNYDPWGTGLTYVGYLLLAFSMAGLLFSHSGEFRRLLRYPMCRWVLEGCLLIFVCLLAYWGRTNAQLVPVLNSPLLCVHVSFIMTAYALLALLLLNALFAFCLPRKAVRLMTLSRMLLYPAVCWLGLGIFIGAVWANGSWGRYWAWDPKEVWALITFMVYALPFHRRSLTCFRRPRFFHFYLILAFLTVLMTYFGVNFFLGGMHSYA